MDIVDPDLLTVKLFVDNDNLVWSISGDGQPVNSNLQPVSFIAANVNRLDAVRLIGNHNNAELILALYMRRLQRDAGCVEVCSPAICRTEEERRDPRRALLAMRRCTLTAATGGWHIFNNSDMHSYQLAIKIGRRGEIDDDVRRTLFAHIAWPALSFIPLLHIDSCCVIVAAMLDPRWYINQRYPNRGSRLRSAFGLDIKTIHGVLGSGPTQRMHNRATAAVRAWGGFEDGYRLIEKPNHFLYRIVRNSLENGHDVATGILRATQTFMDYLRLTWIDGTTAGKKQTEALFVPEYFFNNKNEVAAYKAHTTI